MIYLETELAEFYLRYCKRYKGACIKLARRLVFIVFLLESGSLKQHLTETFDFGLLPEIAWKLLVSWFGVVDGQSPIERTVILQGLYVKSLKVEVYLTEVKLNVYGKDKKDEVKATFSQTEKLRERKTVRLSHYFFIFYICRKCNRVRDKSIERRCGQGSESVGRLLWQFLGKFGQVRRHASGSRRLFRPSKII